MPLSGEGFQAGGNRSLCGRAIPCLFEIQYGKSSELLHLFLGCIPKSIASRVHSTSLSNVTIPIPITRNTIRVKRDIS